MAFVPPVNVWKALAALDASTYGKVHGESFAVLPRMLKSSLRAKRRPAALASPLRRDTTRAWTRTVSTRQLCVEEGRQEDIRVATAYELAR